MFNLTTNEIVNIFPLILGFCGVISALGVFFVEYKLSDYLRDKPNHLKEIK